MAITIDWSRAVPAPASSRVRAADAPGGVDVGPLHDVLVAVWDVLSTITDARPRRRGRHELATVLALSVAAVVAHVRALASIAD